MTKPRRGTFIWPVRSAGKGIGKDWLEAYLIDDFSIRHTNMGHIIDSVIGRVTAVDTESITISNAQGDITLPFYGETHVQVGDTVEAHYMSFDGEQQSVIGLYRESAMTLYTSEQGRDQVSYHVSTTGALVEMNYSEIQKGDTIFVYADTIMESFPAQVIPSRITE